MHENGQEGETAWQSGGVLFPVSCVILIMSTIGSIPSYVYGMPHSTLMYVG